ncbi:MAG: diaminopimelate decarboxylase [Elusimicrobiota bacterium]|jgi:diaminopimelate decarboxylase
MIEYRRDRLFVEGFPADRLVERFGTPLYAYSTRAVLEAYGRVRAAFSRPGTMVCYALKANPNAGVCRLLARQGAGAEVVSGGELRRALAAGFPPEKIVFSGVGKTEEELRLAVRSGILAVNLESEAELDLLDDAARSLGRRAGFSVRLNPDVDAGTHEHVTTGTAAAKFGVERPRALAMYLKAARSRRLSSQGIHCHIGSQVTSVAPYRKACAAVVSFVGDLERRGVRLGFIDLGGGMGVSYGFGKGLDLPALASALSKELSSWPDKRLIVEPGRCLVAGAGVLLTTVLFRKKTTKKDFIVTDAGMTELLRPALYGAKHPILPARRRKGGASVVDVVGPVCETADHLGRGVKLGPCKQGDVLAVLMAGAYGFSMSSQYNSRPRPAEVLVDGNRAWISRQRETYRDIIRGEV